MGGEWLVPVSVVAFALGTLGLYKLMRGTRRYDHEVEQERDPNEKVKPEGEPHILCDCCEQDNFCERSCGYGQDCGCDKCRRLSEQPELQKRADEEHRDYLGKHGRRIGFHAPDSMAVVRSE